MITTAIVVRLVAFFLVAAAAFFWAFYSRRYWNELPPKFRRISPAVGLVFFANGIALLNAAYHNRPLPYSVYILALSYAILVFAAIWTPKNERNK